ncbi:MAG: hypothetical protein EOR84_26580 [Mesorhizobium sp.]|uniref:NAD-dependent epimerase/dehydratase family protein n=1 Tax=Mesorhizobium sp. TaxID=1871066 RepID=UPI000FE67D33|nr:NAD-dependent epimerase/dehydratase family protein [Mesorhizobium sp.]RWM88752.1 MAG: hypothetical protein EOR84_26580 [Mesorhizobium sp.]
MEKYLVVGASRGIGLGLVEALLADGRSVVAMSRDGASHAAAANWVALDITQRASCDRGGAAADIDIATCRWASGAVGRGG